MCKKEIVVVGVGGHAPILENMEFAGSVLESWLTRGTYPV